MRGGFRIGKLFGIDIALDWSWIFIFLLVTWNLAGGVFPQAHPDWGAGLNWVIGISAALLFFGSVLAHELAHSLVAKARGLPVRRITLFLFGGVSNIEREPATPGTEFLMAVVGPITSVVLGIVFLFIGTATAGPIGDWEGDPTAALARLSPISTLLLWLGPINILVGLFNLIPGFPLDGGRILRSILWAATHNLRKATRWAATIGQIIAWLFIVAGVAMVFGLRVPVFGSGVISGLWLAFIGWFLNNAAVLSYRQLEVKDLLEDVPVTRLMRTGAPVVPPNVSISHLVDQWIMKTDEHAFPVVAEDRLIGMVCLHDVRAVPHAQWGTTLVSDIMTPVEQIAAVTPGEDANVALAKLAERDVRQLPVVDHGHLIGMLRRRDILRWLKMQSEFGVR